MKVDRIKADHAKIDVVEIVNKAILTFESENGVKEGIWKTPLISVISADNPLIPKLKEAVSPDHLLPEELLPGAKSVVVFFVPFENRIVSSNLEGEAASEDWAKAYILTNSLIGFISDEIEKVIYERGFKMEKIKATHNFNEKTLMSQWSHRHFAWIAGLGTFGINNMLITPNGCCGRFGSFITTADYNCFCISPAKSPLYGNDPKKEKCLYKRNGSCGLCQKKCVHGAYGEGGEFYKHKCYEACLKNASLYKHLGLADVCGKCLVGLPCSTKSP